MERGFPLEMCTGMGMTGILRIPRNPVGVKGWYAEFPWEWKSMLRGSRGMEKIARDSRGFIYLLQSYLPRWCTSLSSPAIEYSLDVIVYVYCMNHYT